MHRVVARKLALLIYAALCPALAFALSETYEGKLIPANEDPPISIVVQLEEVGGVLSGKIRGSPPLKGNSTIEFGQNVAGKCDLDAALSGSASLRMTGSCSAAGFEGYYIIYNKLAKTLARGTFQLARKAPATKGSGSGSADAAAGDLAVCAKANARCVSACPSGNINSEYLCTNRCRTKLQACKGRANNLEVEPE